MYNLWVMTKQSEVFYPFGSMAAAQSECLSSPSYCGSKATVSLFLSPPDFTYISFQVNLKAQFLHISPVQEPSMDPVLLD